MEQDENLDLAIRNYEEGNYSESLRISEQILELDRNNERALNVLAMSLHEQGLSERAIETLEKATKINPEYYAAHNNKAIVYSDLGHYNLALRSVEQAIKLSPHAPDSYVNKAKIFYAAADYESSIATAEKAIAMVPTDPRAYACLAASLFKCDRYAEALTNYSKAIALGLDDADTYNNRGNTLRLLKRHGEALADYNKAISISPNYAGIYVSRGNVLWDLNRLEEALAAYSEALALKPDLAEAWLGRGNVLMTLRRHQEALNAYDKAVALKPGLAETWLGRGNVLMGLGRYQEALVAYDKAVALKPDLAEAWLGRSNVFKELQRYDEALQSLRQLVLLCGDFDFAKGYMLHAAMLCCDWSDLSQLYESIRNDLLVGKRSAEPFGYQAISNSASELKRCAEIYCSQEFPTSPTPLCSRGTRNTAKIRIGYLSGEFRNQAVSNLMVELFELHDKTKFEFVAFDNGWDDGSETRKRINQAFDEIVDISAIGDFEVATLIEQTKTDILVNLNGYFGRGRTGIFSQRPSPIQVNYLGFSGTMGANYIDYILADRYVIPQARQSDYTEKIVYLPDTFQVSDSQRMSADRLPTRGELNLPDAGFIFCCFNSHFKITPAIFDIWMRLLKKIEGSVLWLSDNGPTSALNLRGQALRRGVAPERLVISPKIADRREYLSRYRLCDLFLDTFPFNAGTIANDALWAGVPLLTCSGETYPSRMAGSLLTSIGVPELITDSLEDYEELASKLAQDREMLASIKARLVSNRKTLSLFNTARFARRIEAAYTTMWERLSRGEPPASFAVGPAV